MEQVSIAEFRQRMAFWLGNLPIQLMSHGNVVGVITAPGEATELQPEALTPEEKRDAALKLLRAAIAPIEAKSKVDKSTGEIIEPQHERRTYTEYSEELGEDIVVTGTFQDFLKHCGGKKQRATAAWKQAKPAT